MGKGNCRVRGVGQNPSFSHQPRRIFLRAGDNDLWAGKSPEAVFADFKEFVAVLQAQLLDTEIVQVTPNPCLPRWKPADKEKRRGELVGAFCRNRPGVACVETFDMVLGADGKPRPELFVADPLHLNAAGYQLLAARVRPYLTK